MSEIPENPIELWEEEHSGLPESSKNNKISVTRRFSQWLDDNSDTDNILNADLSQVKNWLQYIHDNEGLAGSTVNQYHNDLRGFYNSWIHNKNDRSILADKYVELDENPANFNLSDYLDFSKSAVKQSYANQNDGIIHVKPTEVRKLRKAADSVRNELLIKILYQTGLRRSEVAALKLPHYKTESHIDTERQVVFVSEDDSKTDNSRTVGYEDLEPELTMWLKQGFRDRHYHADESPYLLLTKQTPQISVQTISRVVRELADKADVQEVYGKDADGNPKRRITAHSLRSAFIIQHFEAGLSSPEIMEISGHEQLETIEKYANVLDEDVIEAQRKADVDFGY
jgi:integrase/recombinase XerD